MNKKKVAFVTIMAIIAIVAFSFGRVTAKDDRFQKIEVDENFTIYNDAQLGGSWGLNPAGGIFFACPCGGNCNLMIPNTGVNSNTNVEEHTNVETISPTQTFSIPITGITETNTPQPTLTPTLTQTPLPTQTEEVENGICYKHGPHGRIAYKCKGGQP